MQRAPRWELDMDEPTLRQLEVFVASAELRELKKIQERLGRSRQGIEQMFETLKSTNLCQVDLWLGSPTGRPSWPFALTPAGELVLPAVKALLRQRDRLNGIVSSLGDEHQGEVLLSCFAVHLEVFLAELMAGFKRMEPLIRINFRNIVPEASPALESELWGPLRTGKVDLVFAGEPLPEFNNFIMYTTSVIAAVRSDHPWRQQGWVDIEELVRHPLLMLFKGYFSRDKIDEALAPYGFEGPAYQMPTARALLRLRDVGFGVPVLADDAINPGTGIPHPVVTSNGSPVAGDVCVHWRKIGSPLSGATKRFLQFVREEMPGQGKRWSEMDLAKRFNDAM